MTTYIFAGTHTDQHGNQNPIVDAVTIQTTRTGTICVTFQRQMPGQRDFSDDFDLMLTPALAEEIGRQLVVASRTAHPNQETSSDPS